MGASGELEILLVEDDPRDAELCIHALRAGGLADHLLWVKDGAEALDFLFRRGSYAHRQSGSEPKLVLLDVRMPRVDGFEVLQQVKADDRTRTLPIVVLTSSGEERDILQSYQLGVNSYVTKPLEFGAFARVVCEVGRYWLGVNRPPSRQMGR